MWNPKSGEDASGVVKRAHIFYLRNPVYKNPFPYLTNYEKVKDQPKWQVEHKKIMDEVEKVAVAARLSVPEQLV